ncbi:large conductance mechanosensitive channel protein MscL [Eubacteriales bacterium OttesenSCG-928-K08]|nr:large conductance mechanosensitive channel protein MscL [Eubacteriales bacterium OttesenSCG-928-K08]
MKKFLLEFKEFAMRGNVMDLAVGVMIGAAFQSVVKSFTDDLLAPIIGLFVKEQNTFLDMEIFGIRYGAFITAVINFVLMAFIVFVIMRLVKTASKPKKVEEPAKEAEPTTKTCAYCQTQINIKAIRCPACTSVLQDEN